MIRAGGQQTKGAHRYRDGYSKWTVLLWVGLLTALILASVVPASASESSGAAAWGLNNDSQLGNGNTTTEKEAVAVKVLTEATAVAGGELYSLALLKTGKVMAWGLNTDGQLGNNTTTTEKEPVEAKGITEAVAISAGADHSLALLKSGKVMAWGLNNDGQLGNGTTTNEKEPVEVKGITEAVAIAAGAEHSLAVLKNGKVMAWGDNNDGQLGNNTTTTEKEPVEVKKITEAVAVAGGEFHSLALLAGGKVMSWGNNNDGQLGNNTTTTEKEAVEVKGITEAVGVAAGRDHSLAALKNGKVMAWGDNNDGQLGNNTTTNEKEPVEVKGITEAAAVAGGEFHSLAVLTSGKVMAWGENNDGQLGNNTTTTEKEPVEVKGLSGSVGGISAGANFSLASYATKPANTTLPAISGEAEDEKTLTASTGTWTGSPTITYSYQWESCNTSGESCMNISGATSSSYAIAHEEVGHTIRVNVTAKNSAGEATATSAATATVAATAPTNTLLPAISGTAKEGETLSASTGGWAGTEPISYTYQWRSCNSSGESCSSISGATSSTYKLTATSVGKTLRIAVTAENSVSSTEAASSASTIVVAPPSNTALPSISGTDEEGKTLKASTGTWTGTEPFSYAYQWRSCNSTGEGCTNISGATKSTYVPGPSNVGGTVRIVVTDSNIAGSTSATSSATSVITAATPPSSTGSPSISGTVKDGQALNASEGTWSGSTPMTYSYQWESCNLSGGDCGDIEGATNQIYTPASSDLETTLRVAVTASNAGGLTHATSAASAEVEPGAPSELESPSISGDPDEGETLRADAGQWGGTENEVAYQWELCNSTGGECANIVGATETNYKPTESDVNETLRLRVGVSSALGAVTAVSSATETIGSTVSKLINTSAPSITGTPQNGHVLSANAGGWLGVTSINYTYQWQKCSIYGAACENITGATSSAYTLSSESVGGTIRVRVHASEEEGAVYETSSATQPVAAGAAPVVEAPPAVSGTGLVGDKITATTGAWIGEVPVSYSYQWERCNEYGESCSAISGGTASTYTLTESDAAHTVRALVTATEEGAGSTEAVSFPLAVSKTTLVNVVEPSISGTYEAQRVLSTDRGIWTGAGSLSFSYAWMRCNEHGESCSTVTGATESSYTPGEADVGHTLEVVVTATGTAGTESVTSSTTPVIVSEPIAPEDIFVPSIEGNLTSGDTLTAQPGTWVSSETISYSYQWQKCNEEGEECTSISGAISSTYKLIEGDIGSTIRVVVTASNLLGTASATSYQSEAVGSAEAPKVSEDPAIKGTAREGAVLFADNGIWSGSRPLNYYYRWERCNSSGESCTAIESASNPSYTAVSGDVGSALRIKITVTNSVGSTSAVSAPALVASGTEGNVTKAMETAEATDPSILAPSTAATLEAQTVKPAIGNSEEVIASSDGLTSSTISKETPGEFAVNTSVGELSFTPLNSSANATTTPTIVNGATAVFAETSHVTDTFVRPTPLGATTLLQMRSAQAPTSFSWEVGLGSDQELEELPDGSVAVVEPGSGPDLESELPGETLESPESESTETPAGEGSSEESAGNEFESSLEEESALEKLPTAPTTTTSEITPKSGELHPQETEAQYADASSAMKSAEEHTADTIVMVIQIPKVLDASGATVPADLSAEGNTVTMTITPSGGTMWPATAELAVAAPSDQVSAAKAPGAKYGFSDPHAATFGHEVEKKFVSNFDAQLKSGLLEVKRARLFLNWNTSPKNKELTNWLKAVKAAGLTPLITLRECEPTPEVSTCPTKKAPTLGEYYNHAKVLIKALLKGTSETPPVRLWGSWNEPDHNGNAFHKNFMTAAYLWGETQRAAESAGCNHHCTVVAGEFAAYLEHHEYVNKYETTIIQAERKHHFPVTVKPHDWGMHDYNDLEQVHGVKEGAKEVLGKYVNKEAQGFVRQTKKLYSSAHIWLTEQGILLQNEKETPLYNNPELQKLAAQDFLRLGMPSEHAEWVYYYLYSGPNAATVATKPHAFDSALLPGEGVTEEAGHPAENPRQAYCVLVLDDTEGCPATDGTNAVIASTVSSSAGTVTLDVNPGGAPTGYYIEYGETAAYGHTTTLTAVTNEYGEQSETVALSGLEPCTTYHYQAEAENAANKSIPSLGGDRTFKTLGCEELEEEEQIEGALTITITRTSGPAVPYRIGVGPWYLRRGKEHIEEGVENAPDIVQEEGPSVGTKYRVVVTRTGYPRAGVPKIAYSQESGPFSLVPIKSAEGNIFESTLTHGTAYSEASSQTYTLIWVGYTEEPLREQQLISLANGETTINPGDTFNFPRGWVTVGDTYYGLYVGSLQNELIEHIETLDLTPPGTYSIAAETGEWEVKAISGGGFTAKYLGPEPIPPTYSATLELSWDPS